MRPSAFAVLRLMTIKYFVGNWTGSSDGFAPRKNLINIAGGSVKYILEVRPVRKQTAVSGGNGCLVDPSLRTQLGLRVRFVKGHQPTSVTLFNHLVGSG